MKRTFLFSTLAASLMIAALGVAMAAPTKSVPVCHYDRDLDMYFDLSVGPSAADAHFNHHQYPEGGDGYGFCQGDA